MKKRAYVIILFFNFMNKFIEIESCYCNKEGYDGVSFEMNLKSK